MTLSGDMFSILQIRKTCEIVMKILRMELTAEGRSDILQQVMAYRGGYSQEVGSRRHLFYPSNTFG